MQAMRDAWASFLGALQEHGHGHQPWVTNPSSSRTLGLLHTHCWFDSLDPLFPLCLPRVAPIHRSSSASKRVPRHEEDDSRPALLSFSQARPNLLQQLPREQVAALASLELFPRGYRDKHLESASKRLRQGFQAAAAPEQQQQEQQPSKAKGGGAPLGPPMLQDLMRVMRDWHAAPESYIADKAPGESAARALPGLGANAGAAKKNRVCTF